MFKKKINYTDFNGRSREEDFYFHLSLPEVTRLEADMDGLLIKDYINKLVSNNNMKDLLSFLEKVILTSYGVKTNDGRSFKKNEELRSEFENSPAYAEFFEMLLTEEGLAQKFGEEVAEKSKNRDDELAPTIVSE